MYQLASTFAILSTLAGSATADDYKRISTKSDYLSIVADKKIFADWGWLIAASDGSLMGQVDGKAAQGKWDWEGGFWCRTISFGSTTMPRNCQSIHVSGKKLVAIRDKGTGDQTHMTIK